MKESELSILTNHPLLFLPVRLLTSLPQGFQKQTPIIVTLENVLPPITLVHHVIDCSRILHSELPDHLVLIMPAPLGLSTGGRLLVKTYVLTGELADVMPLAKLRDLRRPQLDV